MAVTHIGFSYHDDARRGKCRFSPYPINSCSPVIRTQSKNNRKRDTGLYSQGVGAAELAKSYGLKGRKDLCLRWAKLSEKAWLEFFKINPSWYNSYFFYAMVLGYQGRSHEMDDALKKACSIARKPRNWKAIRDLRKQIQEVVKALHAA